MIKIFCKKNLIVLLFLLFLFSSCASTNNENNNAQLQTLSRRQRNTLDNLKSELYKDSLSYAEKQVEVLSLDAENIIGKDSPIYKHRTEVPLLEGRINEFTKELKPVLESSTSDVSNDIFSVLEKYNISNNNFNYFYEESLSFTELAIEASGKAINDALSKTLDVYLKENNLYSKWDEIFKTYNFWKLHFDNIKSIAGSTTYESQKEISLLSWCVTFMREIFKDNLIVGERIAKESKNGGWKSAINMLYY